MSTFCSIGFHCHTSQILKRNNLKTQSYPFDWIFSNLFIVKDCIQDDFKKLLNKNYYIDSSDKDKKNKCGHLFYKNNMFRHRDMREIENYKYLARCKERFLKLLKSCDNKVFLMTILDKQLINNVYKNLLSIKKIIDRKSSNFTIVCFIFHRSKINYYDKKMIDNIHIFNIYCTSYSNGFKFKNEKDNEFVDNIIKKYYLNNKDSLNKNDIQQCARKIQQFFIKHVLIKKMLNNTINELC